MHQNSSRLIISLLIGVSFVIGVTLGTSSNVIGQQVSIPSWVKNTALWWGQGQISDADFIKALQWLVNQGLLTIPSTSTSPSTTNSVQSVGSITLTYTYATVQEIDLQWNHPTLPYGVSIQEIYLYKVESPAQAKPKTIHLPNNPIPTSYRDTTVDPYTMSLYTVYMKLSNGNLINSNTIDVRPEIVNARSPQNSNTNDDTIPQTMSAVTGEWPHKDGNVYVVYAQDFTIYGEPSDSAALFDYQQFVASIPVAPSAIKTLWNPPANNNAQCTIIYQVTPESGTGSVLHIYFSAVCIEGKFVFDFSKDGVGDNVISNAKDFANNIVSKIPKNGE